MFQIIIYLIITIGIIHFTLYYFNFDFNFENFNYFQNGKNKISKTNSNRSIEINADEIIKITSHANILNDSINELKTLNECINNGEINTFFS